MSQQSLKAKFWSDTLDAGDVFTVVADQGFKNLGVISFGGTVTVEPATPTKIVDADNPATLRTSKPIVVPENFSYNIAVNPNELLDNIKITAGAGATVLVFGTI